MEIKIFQNPMCLNVLFCVNREDSPYTDSTVLSNRVLPNPVGVHVWEEELDITFSPSIQYSSLCKSCTPDSLADFLAVWFSWPMDMNRYDIPLLKEALIVHCDAILLFPPPPQIQPNIVPDMGRFLRLYSSVKRNRVPGWSLAEQGCSQTTADR